jgi:hypothetical protein
MELLSPAACAGLAATTNAMAQSQAHNGISLDMTSSIDGIGMNGGRAAPTSP